MRDCEARLGDVVEFVRGVTFKPNEVTNESDPLGLACLRTSNVKPGLALEDLVYIPRAVVKNSEKLVRRGDIIVSTANSWNRVGACAWVDELDFDAAIGGFISVMRVTNPVLDSRFLFHWFSSPKVQANVRSFGQQTTNISNLNVNRTLDQTIPLPQLSEQRRIAAILDEADELRAKRRQTLALLDENRSSVVREFLTADAAGTDSVSIRDVSNLVTKGTTPTSLGHEYTSEGVPFLRVQDLTDNSLENSPSVLFVSNKTHEVLSRSKIFAGDVLISIAGTIGRTAVVPENSGEMNCNQAVAIIRPNERILPEYLCSWLESPEAMRQIGLESVTATIANLSLGVLSKMNLPLPPVSRQLELVRRLHEFKRVRTQMLKSMEAFDELFASLQDRAFKGEL